MSHSTKTTAMNLSKLAFALAATAALGGCATANNPNDPFEGFNRGVFTFNDTVDKVALKPVAKVYKAVLPSFVQTGVGNFFGNLADVWSSANNLMQGKGEAGMSDFTRVMLNSSFGILGLFDIASEAGLTKHDEDFGQTLGYWGVTSGPYIMLPLLGPSTMRDTVALPLDIKADPWGYKDPVNVRNIGSGVRLIDKRAYLLDASNLLEGAALDRYEFVRDGYLQQRENKIFGADGNPRNKAKKDDAAALDTGAGAPVAAEIAAPLSSEPAVKELTMEAPAGHNASL
ncbi:phospholipid-binding lipoprotein MlaA [Janthinobacterium sp. CG_23.3]|uniref:MlaA family lipoprotein n=1 Tax=Janthinobacterium sp. CG_23.3 TaxID=3349634 RepID=UPI0038D458FB